MSFPSFSSFPDLDPGPSASSEKQKSNEKKSRHEKDKKKSKEKDREKDRHGSKKRHRSRSRDGSRRSRREDEYGSQGRHDEKPAENLPLYYSDKRGDKLNVEYGGLHTGDVPKYHLVAREYSASHYPKANRSKVERRYWAYLRHGLHLTEVVTELKLALKFAERYAALTKWEVFRNSLHDQMSELTDPKARALLEAPPTCRMLQSSDKPPVGDTDDFLSLSSRSKKAQDSNGGQQRSIEMVKDEVDSEEDSEASEDEQEDESSADESGGIELTSYQLKLKDLNQKVEQEPSSSRTWLLLLRHMLSTVPITSKNATVARAEITLSVMTRAMQAHPSNQSSKLLRLTYMKAGEMVWDNSKLEGEWEGALKVGGAEIWMEWLEWRIRGCKDGTDGVIQDSLRVLKALGRSDEDELLKVRVLWRIALVFKNAGYSERSTALFQAQAELTFDLPWSLYNASYEERVEKLEEYWESEVPRVGEEGAEGWSAWVDGAMRESKQNTQSHSQNSKDVTDLDPYRLWWKRECHEDRTHLVPSRSYSETDDPYGTILFSDIQPLLVSLESEAARNAFRFAWLSVLGLHIPGLPTLMSPQDETNWDDRWNLSPLISPNHLESLFPSDSASIQLTTESVVGTIIGRERIYSSAFGPVRNWSHGILPPLSDPSLDSIKRKAKTRYGLWNNADTQEIDQAFVRRVFSQLRMGDADEEWDEYSLAFEASISAKGAIKHSRSLLKQAESLPRWIAHTQLEILRGHPDDARKVYEAVSKTIPNVTSDRDVGQFWWTWAEMEWLARNGTRSLEIILQSVQLSGDGRIVMLRARRNLDERIQAVTDWKGREYWIRLRVLLEILSTQDPSVAVSVMDTYLEEISERGIPHESLTVAMLSILFHYSASLKGPMPPVILRDRAHRALEIYPSNSIILGIFLEGERGQSVWGRTKKLFGEGEGEAKDVARRLEDLWVAGWERAQWNYEVERTRNGLAGAVDNERTRGSYILWRLYLEFEIKSGDLGRAKKIFYRAIGECPMVKELYLIGFGPLRGVFNGRELKGIAETMVERGIRIWHDLDEILSGWSLGEKGIEQGDSESEEDEIMADAKEYRRLLPY